MFAAPACSAPKAVKPAANEQPKAVPDKTKPPATRIFPKGVMQFDTLPPAEGVFAKEDMELEPKAVAVAGNSLWVGRRGGLRKYDRITGKWEFLLYDNEVCPGLGTSYITSASPYIWARRRTTGKLCRFDPTSKNWYSMNHWSILAHSGPGADVIMSPDYIYVASEGGPDWEGVSIIDTKTHQFLKLFKTKPITAMHIDPRFIWVGVPEGILRINRVTEEYTYFQPNEYKGGVTVNGILPIPGALAFATSGDHTGILGDRIKVYKDHIEVYVKKYDQWYKYRNSDRKKLIRDIELGRMFITNLHTTPGLVILRNGKWRRLGVAHGLPANDIQGITKDEKFLYVATVHGIAVLDLVTLKPRDINQHIYKSLLATRRIISDGEFLWVVTVRGVFRVEKKLLFSFPR